MKQENGLILTTQLIGGIVLVILLTITVYLLIGTGGYFWHKEIGNVYEIEQMNKTKNMENVHYDDNNIIQNLLDRN